MNPFQRNHTVEVIKLLNDMADASSVIIREIDNQELESKLLQTTDLFETTKRKLDLAESKLSEFKLKDQAKSRVHELESKAKEKESLEKDKELVKYRNDIKTLEEQKCKAINELSKLRLKMKSMETELSKHKANVDAIVDIDNIKSNLHGSEKKRSELERVHNELKLCNAKLQSEVKIKDEELSKLMIELEQLRSQGGGDSSKIAELTNEVRMLKFEKDDLREERTRLQEEKMMLIKDFVRFFVFLFSVVIFTP